MYKEVDIETIYGNFSERQRQSYGKVDELAQSIKESGLLQPIVVEPSGDSDRSEAYALIAGGRRLKACHLAGLEKIPVMIRDNLSPIERQELELIENLQREDLTWQEECQAQRNLDEMKKKLLGDSSETRSKSDWSVRKTADLLDRAPSGVSQDIALAEAMDMFPDLANSKNKSEAHKRFKGLVEGMAMKTLIKREEVKSGTVFKFASSHYMTGNALTEMAKMEPTPIPFAEVDPPYGIELHHNKKIESSEREKLDSYDEIPKDNYPQFVGEVGAQLFHILAPNAWMIWWFGQEWYYQVRTVLTEVGFEVDPIPGIWVKDSFQGQTNQPEKYLARCYESFFICRKGNPSLVKRGQKNVFTCKPVSSTKKIHSTEKPLYLMEQILNIFCFPGTSAIVPFLGSGVTLRALYMKNLSGFGWDLSSKHKDRFLYQVSKDVEEGLYGNKEAE